MKHYYLIFVLLFSVTSSFAQTLEDDRLALKAIYENMSFHFPGEPNVHYVPWNFPGNPGDSPCGWAGISCENDRVTGLSLSEKQLDGQIPKEIGNLTALITLSLGGGNGFGTNNYSAVTGQIPPEIGKLVNLRHLDLSSLNFSGSIPASFGNLVQLRYLSIAYKDYPGQTSLGSLSGSIPTSFSKLVNLETLILSRQNLSGAIPVFLGNLTKLKHLDLSDNFFNGPIPASFANLQNLTALNLSYTANPVRTIKYGALGDFIPDLSGIPISANVDISGNSFTFEGMVSNISRLDHYTNQAKIQLYQGNGAIYASHGGSGSSVSYFYRDNQIIQTINGTDMPMFSWKGPGKYRIEATDASVPGLTLVSDEVDFETFFPVKLTFFSVKNNLSENLLTWKTTSETNNKGFQIERSVDAKTFENIGFVDGLGDNLGDKTYTFLDAKPYFKTYYRLKQLDWNGKSEYSRIITVKQDKTKLSVYPNPAKNEFFVSGLDREEAVEIRDYEGRVVLEQKVNPAQPVRTGKLSNGLYLIKVGEETRKVVIQN
ncbi:T9SS type A sorting domain-containing protein [Dyadobacter sp. CY345]|uniref:T9SS type A sorting domain-containing protein n=1 Tax=Dyadobacter sp. CY345 TaxID=2909335 RepID=UPI001F4570F4|nr:T9SS type A sorting domain-containing protein [Dyadobacter sp. CY345]MCF2444427.1 T9SS type A sorting domain-containing protein [Dyadobacter sp. CY345]